MKEQEINQKRSIMDKGAIRWFLIGVGGLGFILCLALVLFGSVGEGADARWTLFLGRFHPLILHLPIGALSVVGSMELVRLFSRGRWQGEVTLALGFAAVSAVVAVAVGFLLGQDSGYGEELLVEHFFWGCMFGVAVCAAFVLHVFARSSCKFGVRFVYLVVLGAGFVAMIISGHYGASLTHGETYLTDHAPPVVRAFLGLPEQVRLAEEVAHLEQSKSTDEQIFFLAHVEPILESKCYACHNENKKKGKLSMTSIEALLEGGEEGAALVIGDAAKSNMIQRIELPEDDRYHMPPKGKDVSESELAILRAWIDTGAFLDKKVGELALPEDLL